VLVAALPDAVLGGRAIKNLLKETGMQWDQSVKGWLGRVSLIACCSLPVAGCQAWHHAAAIPGLGSTQGERQVLKQAKNDPFPSPSDVGLSQSE
jgi:hypothetical protein